MPRSADSDGVQVHLAVIDLGTNAIRLQVARVFDDATYRVICDFREPVRLGEELFRTGQLSRVAIDRSIATLERFEAIARRHHVTRIRTVATSAVREASNGFDFVKEATERTGIALEIISGDDEARLIARGILSELSEPLRRGRLALVDVGGGSTELSIVEDGELRRSCSLPLGSVRATQLHCTTDPLSAEEERRLRAQTRAVLEAELRRDPLPRCDTILGSAGTIGALANYLRRAQGSAANRRSGFSPTELARASAALRAMGVEARRAAPGIYEHRAEAIVAGALILEEICETLGAKWIRPVRRGLRDGAMVEAIEAMGIDAPRLRRGRDAPPPP